MICTKPPVTMQFVIQSRIVLRVKGDTLHDWPWSLPGQTGMSSHSESNSSAPRERGALQPAEEQQGLPHGQPPPTPEAPGGSGEAPGKEEGRVLACLPVPPAGVVPPTMATWKWIFL